MKHVFAVAVIFTFLNLPVYAADITDAVDMQFINNAFSDPNPTTNKEFEDVMERLENPREGVFTKIFKFFEKDKLKYDKAFKTKYENPSNQPLRLKDVPEEKPTVLITSTAYDSFGNRVNVGYYQIECKKEDNGYKLELMQGANKQIATVIARPISEDEKAPAIVYGRAEALNNGFIKITSANLDLTLLGYLKMEQTRPLEFAPLF